MLGGADSGSSALPKREAGGISRRASGLAQVGASDVVVNGAEIAGASTGRDETQTRDRDT